MKFARAIVILLLVIGGSGSSGLADDGVRLQVANSPAAQAGVVAPTPSCVAGGCITRSRGYTLPGFEVCPCGNSGCFHPARYYCGGKPYRKHWFRKWLCAHFGHGSMLENVPCHCVHPVSLHTAPAVPTPQHSAPETVVAPVPAAQAITPPDGDSGM